MNFEVLSDQVWTYEVTRVLWMKLFETYFIMHCHMVSYVSIIVWICFKTKNRYRQIKNVLAYKSIPHDVSVFYAKCSMTILMQKDIKSTTQNLEI